MRHSARFKKKLRESPNVAFFVHFFPSYTRLHRSSCPKRHLLILYVFPTLPHVCFGQSRNLVLCDIYIYIYIINERSSCCC
uniref:Uncharacterized protein n=1 Tax=Rhipicephalus appendiculatus TaxID=34631 RepID=A0A131YC38_RHIAP